MKLDGAGIINIYYLFRGKNGKDAEGDGVDIRDRHIINIPHYQRPYRWTSEKIDYLFEDYNDNSKKTGVSSEYFVGATVAVENEKQNTFDLVDGQQRTTTIYLINYIRYALCVKLVEHRIEVATNFGEVKDDIANLKDIYSEFIGYKNEMKFDKLKDYFSKTESDFWNDDCSKDEGKRMILEEYRNVLGLVASSTSKTEFYDEYVKKQTEFFEDEELCLQYSRKCYTNYLKEALCNIYVDGNKHNSEMEIEIINVSKNENITNYINALEVIFKNTSDYCRKRYKVSNEWEFAEKMVEYLSDILNKLRMCIILTKEEDDAYTLFEVLNDRSLDVDDLELVKNHFYRIYCNNSKDNEDKKSKVIDKLDKIWVEHIFSGTKKGQKKNRLISYLATLYMTQSEKFDNKNVPDCKNEIKKNYTDALDEYSAEDIERDFNIFYAIKEMIDVFEIQFVKADAFAVAAECNNTVSITYKTFALLYALDRPAVLGALSNFILAKYMDDKKSLNINDFRNYLIALKNDKTNSNTEYLEIHKCAFMLRRTNLLAKDYIIPREEIATKIIKENGLKTRFQNKASILSTDTEKKLVEEFDQWINEWTYKQKHLRIKILYLILYGCLRTEDKDIISLNKKDFKLEKAAYSYNFEPDKINLDHLESATMRLPLTAYFMNEDKDKRSEYVNSLGNMMILDSEDNNIKNNAPLKDSLRFYSKNKSHWLYTDLEEMIKSDTYFDGDIPKTTFFDKRKKILIASFRAILQSEFDEKCIEVRL